MRLARQQILGCLRLFPGASAVVASGLWKALSPGTKSLFLAPGETEGLGSPPRPHLILALLFERQGLKEPAKEDCSAGRVFHIFCVKYLF